MPDRRIADRVRERIRDGILPRAQHDKRWVGHGRGDPCDACDQSILPAQIEHELDFADGRRFRFHIGCAGLYEAALLREGRKPSD